MSNIYACSDFHGYLDIYHKICNKLKPKDKVFFLGDAGDRGPKPWETIKAILSNPQWEYIQGNHDDMLIKAFYEVTGNLDNYGIYRGKNNQYLLHQNGGRRTLDELLGEESPEKWIKRLHSRPKYISYTNKNGINCVMTHAGFTPKDGDDSAINIPTEELLWDREHIWEENELEKCVIVHGHDPIDYLAKLFADSVPMGAYNYTKGKWCIDNGTYRTGTVILFNLDTFKSEIITTDMEVKN